MKLLDLAIASAAVYSAWKIIDRSKGVASLHGEYDFRISPQKADTSVEVLNLKFKGKISI